MYIKVTIKIDSEVFYDYTVFDPSWDSVYQDARTTYPEATHIILETGTELNRLLTAPTYNGEELPFL